MIQVGIGSRRVTKKSLWKLKIIWGGGGKGFSGRALISGKYQFFKFNLPNLNLLTTPLAFFTDFFLLLQFVTIFCK